MKHIINMACGALLSHTVYGPITGQQRQSKKPNNKHLSYKPQHLSLQQNPKPQQY